MLDALDHQEIATKTKLIMSPTEDSNKLQFKGANPGAVQYGNFINYYQFHPPDDRVKLLPKNIWITGTVCIALDIGCNAGVNIL